MEMNYNGKLVYRRYMPAIQLLVLSVFLLVPVGLHAGAVTNVEDQAEVKAVFGKDCQNLLMKEIRGAQKEIKIAIFSITHEKIVKSLIAAKKRGVVVTVKFDAGQKEWETMKEAIKELKDHKIQCTPIEMSSEHAGMHHKFTIIDGARVLTGSFNYSTAGAWNNYENLVLIVSEKIADQFDKEFESIVDR